MVLLPLPCFFTPFVFHPTQVFDRFFVFPPHPHQNIVSSNCQAHPKMSNLFFSERAQVRRPPRAIAQGAGEHNRREKEKRATGSAKRKARTLQPKAKGARTSSVTEPGNGKRTGAHPARRARGGRIPAPRAAGSFTRRRETYRRPPRTKCKGGANEYSRRGTLRLFRQPAIPVRFYSSRKMQPHKSK